MKPHCIGSLLLAPLALGCGDSTDTATAAGAGGGSLVCPPDALTMPDGSCRTVGLPPDMACPPGELALGDGSCQPAGVPPGACGDGFQHDGDRGCQPILPSAPCPNGMMAVPGDASCREVAPCGNGKWGDIPVEVSTQYVDVTYAAMDSDGTAAKPWITIAAAIAAAANGAVIAVAAGSYAEDVDIGKPVRLWGVCPAQVVIAGVSGGIPEQVLVRNGADATEIHTLAVSGPGVGLFLSGSGGIVIDRVWLHDNGRRAVTVQTDFGATEVTVRGSLVEANPDVGISAYGSTVTLDSSVVRDTGPELMSQWYGRGVTASYDSTAALPSTLELTRSVIEANREIGVLVLGSTATIDSSVIRSTVPDTLGQYGRGVAVEPASGMSPRASLVLSRSLIDGNRDTGVHVLGADAELVALVVRGTELDTQGLYGWGVSVIADAVAGPGVLDMRESLVEDNHEHGVFVGGAEANLEAVAVRGTLPNAAGGFGRGVGVEPIFGVTALATVDIHACLVDANQEAGVVVSGSMASITNTAISRTEPSVEGIARGLNLDPHPGNGSPATATVSRSLVEGSSDVGIHVSGSGLTIEDSVIRDTASNARGTNGRGFNVQSSRDTGQPSTLTATGVLVEDSLDAGMAIISATAYIQASIVRSTGMNANGAFGDGVLVFALRGPASANIASSRVEQSARAALSSFGGAVTASNVTLLCQTFDLDAEPFAELAPSFTDAGGNLCGCPTADAECRAVSAGLEPPEPID